MSRPLPTKANRKSDRVAAKNADSIAKAKAIAEAKAIDEAEAIDEANAITEANAIAEANAIDEGEAIAESNVIVEANANAAANALPLALRRCKRNTERKSYTDMIGEFEDDDSEYESRPSHKQKN
jgi:membrane protein involved in colicin uptake